jgi:TonB family protein
MKNTILFGLLAICGLSANSQTITEKQQLSSMRSYLAQSDYVYPYVDTPPMYPGGDEKWSKYVNGNSIVLNAGMEAAQKGLATGHYLVTVRFRVNEDGSVGEVRTLGSKVGYGLEEAAIALVKNSGLWTPANVEGSSKKSWMQLQVRFHVFE